MAAQSDHSPIICLTGPESSGKSTLAKQIAEHFDIPLVEEVARTYLAQRLKYTPADVLEIARLQLHAEMTATAQGKPVVLDTDITVLWVWWRTKYGEPPKQFARILAARAPRIYLLLTPDLPWEVDPQRENPDDRLALFALYQQLLQGSGSPYQEVIGTSPEREKRAFRFIQDRYGISR